MTKNTVTTIIKILAVSASGLLVASGFPGLWCSLPGYVLPFALVPLFWLLESLIQKNTGKQNSEHWQQFKVALLWTWICGFIIQLCAFFWISQDIIYFSTVPAWGAYPLYALISSLTALYFPVLFAPALLDVWYSNKYVGKRLPVWVIAVLMMFLETVIPRFFNWSFASLMHSVTLVNQLSSLLGFNAVSFAMFFTSLSLARFFVARRDVLRSARGLNFGARLLGPVIILWGAISIFGWLRVHYMAKELQQAPTTRVAFVQPNFTFNSLASFPLPSADAQVQSFGRLLAMSQEAIAKALAADRRKPDILIWPESALGVEFAYNLQLQQVVSRFVATTGVPVLVQSIKFGARAANADMPEWSVSYLIKPDGTNSDIFAKWIPMPFGEEFPLERHFPILGKIYRQLFTNASKLEVGTSYQALPYTSQYAVAPLICFDSIYPELARLETLKGQASFLTNQANFVWMVDSNAGMEFSVIDQFRAIENARSLVMVSNTGPTVAFDPLGQVLLPHTKLLTQATGFVDIPIYTGFTFYSKYSNWPLIIIGLLALFYLAIFIWIERKRQHAK